MPIVLDNQTGLPVFDGAKVFAQYSATNPVPEEAAGMLQYICDKIGNVLGEILDQPFGLASYSQAKLAYLKWMLEDAEYLEKFGALLDDQSWGMWRNLYGQLIDQLQVIVDNPAEFSKKTGVTNEVLIAKVPFSDEAKALLEGGELTIGRLLQIQPGIILNNTDS